MATLLTAPRTRCLTIVLTLVGLPATPVLSQTPTLRTENVVLVTVDGLRHQELFSGLDPIILEAGREDGIESLDSLRERFWRDTPRERRESLLPFFWNVLVPAGVLVGNGDGGTDVTVTNPHRVSYPGYAEILTGEAQPDITGNDPVWIPRETVLEFVRRRLDLDTKSVAAFTSWDHFSYIVARRQGEIFVNAGARPLPDDLVDDELQWLNKFQARVLQPWETVRLNAFTEQFALAYLEAHRPRFLYLAFDETDEWAHAGRYDRTVHAIRYFDDTLRLLWERLQKLDTYRDKTTLIITTDHGRGRTAEDWISHGKDVPGAEETWLAIVGPDTPARGLVEAEEALHQNQIAATIVKFFGLEPAEFNPKAGKPIDLAFR